MKSLPGPFKVGDYYVDCGYIPRICTKIGYEIIINRKGHRVLKQTELVGRSLIDGSTGFCSIRYCAPEKIDRVIARRWAKTGPLSIDIKTYLKVFYTGEWGAGRKIWWKE